MAKLPPPPPSAGIQEISLDDEAFDPVETGQLWAERPEEREADDFAARLSEATSNLEDIALGSIAGDETSSITQLPSADPVRGVSPRAQPVSPAGRQAMSETDGYDPNSSLQLDLSRAGLSAQQGVGQALPGQPRPGAIAAQTSTQDVAHAVAQGLPVAEASKSMLARQSPVVKPERVTLFGPDPVLAFLVAAAIGLLVGIVPAARSAANLYEDETAEAFAELEAVIDKPLAIRAGTVRAPAAIEGELAAVAGPTRIRFFLVWFAVALPITLVLGLIRRRA